jgi:aspartyl-tRNA(Asn)/glutamyl-tRNA(Gln) amidotransferase subunit A
MSIATAAFNSALERLAAQVVAPPQRRPAIDVFRPPSSQARTSDDVAPRPPAAPLPALGGMPTTGAIAAAARSLEAGDITCVELTEQALARIAQDEWTGFVEVISEEALTEARARDAELRAGRRRGPLHGIPVSVKDVIDVRGVRTRCGSDAYDVVPSDDADAVDLWRSAGAVILGKTSTHEFALGVTSPQARNPHDPTRIPGGSSGGSAIAVATGMGLASLGTDTRASIRVPAALCGVVGLKPTYGTVPTRGVVPLSWTMDHVAVMAGSAEDAALALDALRPDDTPIAPAAGARARHWRSGRERRAHCGARDIASARTTAIRDEPVRRWGTLRRGACRDGHHPGGVGHLGHPQRTT